MLDLKDPMLHKIKTWLDDICLFYDQQHIPLPVQVQFWHKAMLLRPRVGIFSPIDKLATKFFNLVANASLQEDLLLTGVYEVSSNSNETLPFQGVQILSAPHTNLFTYSLVVFGAKPNSGLPENISWLDFVATAIIISPAHAVLGRYEVELIEKLLANRRLPLLIITHMEGDNEEDYQEVKDEIEKYKLIPLQRKMGLFPVLYSIKEDDNSIQQAITEAEDWLVNNIQHELIRQIINIGHQGLKEAETVLADRLAQNSKAIKQLTHFTNTLNIKCIYFTDLASRQTICVTNSLYEQMEIVLNDCISLSHNFTLWLYQSQGNWNDFIIPITERLNTFKLYCLNAPQLMIDLIEQEFNKFTKQYGGLSIDSPFNLIGLSFIDYKGIAEEILRQPLKEFIYIVEQDAFIRASHLNINKVPQKDMERFAASGESFIWKKTKGMISNFSSLSPENNFSETIKIGFEEKVRTAVAAIRTLILQDINGRIEHHCQVFINSFAQNISREICRKKRQLQGEESGAKLSELARQWHSIEVIFENEERSNVPQKK